MSDISENLRFLNERIAAACHRAERSPASVRLVAVSKAVAPSQVALAMAAGGRDFGESYLQESVPKIEQIRNSSPITPTWHFIGPVQGNKAAAVAEHFAWVHAVDREKIAQRLSSARPQDQPPLNMCVQVNVSAEASKSGCAPEDAPALCAAVAALPNLQLRGLMTIPVADMNAARASFRRLRQLFERIRQAGAVDQLQFDTLSMGMSGDFEAAIEEGATLIRVGSALFGARPKK